MYICSCIYMYVFSIVYFCDALSSGISHWKPTVVCQPQSKGGGLDFWIFGGETQNGCEQVSKGRRDQPKGKNVF